VRGPLVEAQFDPANLPDLLSALTVTDDARRVDVTVEVAQRREDGVVCCVAVTPIRDLRPVAGGRRRGHLARGGRGGSCDRRISARSTSALNRARVASIWVRSAVRDVSSFHDALPEIPQFVRQAADLLSHVAECLTEMSHLCFDRE